MKKLLILLLLLITFPAFADTHTATKNGCWADATVWDPAAVPENGDSVVIADKIVTTIGNGITDCSSTPSATIPATGTLVAITGTSGYIQHKLDDDDCHGGCSISATTITGGTNPIQGLLFVTGTTDHVLGLTLGTGASEGAVGTQTNDVGQNIVIQTTGTINMTGTIKGGVYSANYGVFLKTEKSTFNHNGNITAGTGQICTGLYINNLTGQSISLNGIISGSTAKYGAAGVDNYSNANVTLSASTTLVNGANSVAWMNGSPAWQPASTSYIKAYVGSGFLQAANTEFPQVLSAGNIKSGVTSGSVTGTLSAGGSAAAY